MQRKWKDRGRKKSGEEKRKKGIELRKIRDKNRLKAVQERRQIDLEHDKKWSARDVPRLPRLKDGWGIENFLPTLKTK